MATRRVPADHGAVWASSMRPGSTGVGVFQRELCDRLTGLGVTVVSPRESSYRGLRALQCFARVVGPPYVAAIVCSTPAPLLLRVPVIAVVYDLRWRRTRGRASRLYRYLDLRRTVNRANRIFAISGRTRDEIVKLFPGAEGKCRVLHLGPGVVGEADFVDGEPGVVLLIGSAGYKRNELVAEALVEAGPEWAERFLCVGVSDVAFQVLVDRFGAAACERFDRIDDDEMRLLFRRSSVYISGSMEEGFGLPMIEALSAGCQVVAICQPLTIEITGDAAVLIDDGDVAHIAGQLRHPEWVPEQDRRARAAMYSWDGVAAKVATELEAFSR